MLGAIPLRADLLEQSSRCDVGLALMPLTSDDVNLRTMAGASNKPFDYLARGLALLVSDLAEWKALFVDPGYGLACNPEDPESIGQALRWFVEHPTEVRRMGERGRVKVEREWNYETQFAPVLRRLTASTANGAAAPSQEASAGQC